jgi:hypothetical protein
MQTDWFSGTRCPEYPPTRDGGSAEGLDHKPKAKASTIREQHA